MTLLRRIRYWLSPPPYRLVINITGKARFRWALLHPTAAKAVAVSPRSWATASEAAEAAETVLHGIRFTRTA